MSRKGGLIGMQYTKKSFAVPTSNGAAEPLSQKELKALLDDRNSIVERQANEVKKPTKVFIPLGDRLIVERNKIGEKFGNGLLYTPDNTAERKTDLATVISLPELTFTDKELIDNAETITASISEKAKNGDAEALVSLMKFNQFLKIKMIQVGDKVFISKYSGIDFHDSNGQDLTVVLGDDVISIVKDV